MIAIYGGLVVTEPFNKYHFDRFREFFKGFAKRLDDEPAQKFRMHSHDRNYRFKMANEVHQLIWRWEDCGRLVYDMEEAIGRQRILGGGTTLENLPDDFFYLHFGRRAGTRFGDAGGFVEGMYVEATKEGVELTFVCNEPSWARLATASHAECLTTFSRSANLLVHHGQTIDEAADVVGFLGDLALIQDGPMDRIIEVASFCLATICKPRLTKHDLASEESDLENVVLPRVYH
jgi:hypothetical protein